MNLDINNYPGAKRNSGLDKWIINMIPRCDTFREAFAGSAHISEMLYEAGAVCKIKVHEKSLHVAKQLYAKFNGTKVVVERVDSLERLADHVTLKIPFDDDVIYFDPPYLKETRHSDRDYYEFEWTEKEHSEFICLLITLNALGVKLIISHPKCKLYDELLKESFERVEFNTMNRGGKTIEYVYRNFDPSKHKLLISDYVGSNRTERQNLKRTAESFVRKIQSKTLHEQQYLLDFIYKNV